MSSNKNYIRDLVDNYCVIDLETTGLSCKYDEVLEIGLLKVRDNKIVDTYSQLVNPQIKIDEFITDLTGITNEMVKDMPLIKDIKEQVLNFIGDDIIIGHNTSFDLNFIQYNFGIELPNKYMDTLQFSRKLFPDLKHHRLQDMVALLSLSNNEHRSLSDCISTKELYDEIKNKMNINNLKINDIFVIHKKGIDINNIVPTDDMIDENNYFYNKYCVFTGTLDKMTRKEAMQLVVNIGGKIDKSVTKKTNYLILGNNDYCNSIKDGKSNKQKKAEQLKLEGQDIEIIDEETFYQLINE